MSSGRASRSLKSCTECHRRKQKCSRQWPCNHCRSRRIPHLCNFGANPSSTQHVIASNITVEGKDADDTVAELQDETCSPVLNHDTIQDIYRASIYEIRLGYSDPFASLQQEVVRSVQKIVPPRPIFDLLVQDFFVNTNYQYCILHATTFLEHYVQWWYAVDHDLRLDPRFTCLLFRACSYAILFLPPEKQAHIEMELAVSAQVLTTQYHHAAQKLSMTISAGKGGLMQVQQLFFTCIWFRSEALFVDAWHVLGSAIREAQEMGMHRDDSTARVSDFERETRTRMWWILYSFDWQMSRGLSRPLHIDQGNCTVSRPNLHADEPDSVPGKPSSFTPMVLQGDLTRDLAACVGRLDGKLEASEISAYLQHVEDWFDSFPACYRLEDPDTTWDASHPYIADQRWQMNVLGHVIKILPLKSFLGRSFTPNSSMEELNFRAKAVECCLVLLQVSHSHLDALLPKLPKQHVATYAIFDTAAFLCSAVMRDQLASLPQADKVYEAVQLSIQTLDRLKHTTSLGPRPFQILKTLAEELSIVRDPASSSLADRKRAKVAAPGQANTTTSVDHDDPLLQADMWSSATDWQVWQDALLGAWDPDDNFGLESLFPIDAPV